MNTNPMERWHPSVFKDPQPVTETIQITDGVISFIAHDRDSAIWWAMLMIDRGLAPTMMKWASIPGRLQR